ncbi:aldolase [Haematobacter missouriensis]|uniref:DUF1476 domain-containing protein n=1 Tax=Haematobacter missouriensis TaxID=366616 RepID=A0A212AYM6_9RHOB|nr:DUF1476 domain-containing protein [Haematobacter missouriensis]KFI33051.1 aldolase [Haematobacter missouriensis]OWJ79836.1 DUF1476 domain-containing protein [Haematobacter missouriensis]OWJ86589.1 DUF1476 domain-containing protein [Haematobacter missouriensis]
MTMFADRERAFEAKFAHDAELNFRAEARRNKLLGLWAADVLAKTGPEATAFAAEIVRTDLLSGGQADVVAYLVEQLSGSAAEADIRNKLDECGAQARREIFDDLQ